MTTIAGVGTNTTALLRAAARTAPVEQLAADGTRLSRKLAAANRRLQLRALLLVLPILLFTLILFVAPIAQVVGLSLSEPTLASEMPLTSSKLATWDASAGLPSEDVFAAAVADLKAARERQTAGKIGAVVNHAYSGARSVMVSTSRAAGRLEAPFRKSLVEANEAWGDPRFWVMLQTLSQPSTSIFYLNAVDRTRDGTGSIVGVPENQRIHLFLFWRTLWISAFVTVTCLVLGYPVAYFLAGLPLRISNLLMICVLLPFWTALLVRITAWIALLQNDGVVLSALVALGAVDPNDRPQLVYNLTGTLLAMIHVLLPSMILPIYSVMKTIPPSYMRAARSLGADAFTAFWRVYFPQTLPGMAAGGLLVFILAVGYYITPALLGGQDGVLISNFIALHMESTLNWGLASALAVLLLLAVLVLYWIFNKVVGVEKLKMG